MRADVARLREVANEYGDLVIFNVEAYRQKHNLQENFTFEAVMKVSACRRDVVGCTDSFSCVACDFRRKRRERAFLLCTSAGAPLQSGLQWEDRKFDSESKVLFGLKSVEKALAPARLGLKGHSFGEDVFVISAKNPPSRDDETFKAWLEARKKEYVRQLRASELDPPQQCRFLSCVGVWIWSPCKCRCCLCLRRGGTATTPRTQRSTEKC